MTALSTLPQSHATRKSSFSKTGVLTLSGFGIKVRMQSGHLEIEDGVGLNRRKFRLPRVGHGLKRLVLIGSDGFVSLAGLEWLASQRVAFVMLERSGKVQCVTGPVRPSDAKLRRAQALALGNEAGLQICRTLIDAKLRAQEQVVRESLGCRTTAEAIARFRDRLAAVDCIETIRGLEASAASAYFREWRDIPVVWPKADLPRIPEHWRFVGNRQSPLSGSPRLAVTPVHAILNYCFALLEAETRLALSSLGLDPGLGVGLHTDTADRDSLALDVLEPIRPQIETWVLDWVRKEGLRRADFIETETGNCRLRSQMCAKLGETAPVWGKLVAPWAEYVTRTLCTSQAGSRTARISPPPTRLTQQRRTEAKGRVWVSTVELPKEDHLCRGCGKKIRDGRTNCAKCALRGATERLTDAARIGRIAGHTLEALAKESNTQHSHAIARSAWTESSQPAWLTEQVYSEKIQPEITDMSSSTIAKRLGVSRWYAGRIRKGYQPHPRHWEALAQLVLISRSEISLIRRQPNTKTKS